jgi:tRNA(fMet)-specific endonuclease VapC
MTQLLLDTNVVSILFKPLNSLYPRSVELVSGHQLFISFMTKAELLLWPALNHWSAKRRQELQKHIEPFTTLFADDLTCDHWCRVIAESRHIGRPITAADAWIAATARQWSLPLVSADFRDYEHLVDLIVVPLN